MCKYCDAKKPGGTYRVGNFPVGKPISMSRDEVGLSSYIVIAHETPAPVCLDRDRWSLHFVSLNPRMEFFMPISYCPMCGRELTERGK